MLGFYSLHLTWKLHKLRHYLNTYKTIEISLINRFTYNIVIAIYVIYAKQTERDRDALPQSPVEAQLSTDE